MNFVNSNKRILIQLISGVVLIQASYSLSSVNETNWWSLIIGLIGVGAILSAASDYYSGNKKATVRKNTSKIKKNLKASK